MPDAAFIPTYTPASCGPGSQCTPAAAGGPRLPPGPAGDPGCRKAAEHPRFAFLSGFPRGTARCPKIGARGFPPVARKA